MGLQIALRGKNIELTDALREHVQKKLGKIARYFHEPPSAQVALSVEKGRHIIEVTMPINGMLLRGEEASEDMYASVDGVVEKLERQIRKFKTRINRRARKGSDRSPVLVEDGEPGFEEENGPRVVRTKRFALKPMDVEEAVLQMNLLGHDFFVFSNSTTNLVNVIYRRRDGNYGLIEPYA